MDEPEIKLTEDDLVYAAGTRCPCGAGMAYAIAKEHPSGKFIHGYWDCSAILLGIADKNVKHEAQLPFAFYSVLSEEQIARTGGATTRPSGVAKVRPPRRSVTLEEFIDRYKLSNAEGSNDLWADGFRQGFNSARQAALEWEKSKPTVEVVVK